MGEEAGRKIQCVLLDDLLDINCRTNEINEVWNNLELSNLNQLNWARLLTTGIGEDYVYLNECMAEGKTLLDFPTLYDYDYADYLFQEEARKRDFTDYKGIEYYIYQHPSWVRLLIQQRFYYATFTSLATYVLDDIEFAEVESFLAEEIDRANAWLVESHQDIQENFDPTVVRLRKKNKIIMSESALDDLSKIDADRE